MSSSSKDAEGVDPVMDQPRSSPTPAAPAIVSNNAPGFKYKYPEAKPTPPGVDDIEWNKIYTAADSRKYNQHGKNANESRKFRVKGETRELALLMLEERREKARRVQLDGHSSASSKKATPKPPPVKKAKIKDEESTTSRDATPAGDKMPMSISEQIKSEGRARKAVSVAPSSSSNQGTPAPTPTNAGPKTSPAKPTKKGTAAPVKRPTKRPNNEGRLGTPSSIKRDSQTPGPKMTAEEDDDSDSNDGGEYCVCRGPDDHRMMVYCEGGCDDWYHCSCIGINVEDARELLDRFVCPKCKTETQFTTWKRMCRLYNVTGCRKAARPTAVPPSMYCSDEHRQEFWDYVANHVARQDNEPSRGGALNKYEIGDLLHQVKTKAELDALGQKPRLPKKGADPGHLAGLDYLTAEEEQTIANIKIKQQQIEEKLQGYRGQHALLKLVNQRAKAADGHADSKGKAICGYDSRLSFNEAQFAKWKESNEGKAALETKILGPRTAETKDIDGIILMDREPAPPEPSLSDEFKSMCTNPKKKCQHRDWYKIHEEDYLYMSKLLKDEYSKLQKKTDDIIDDAETREATKDDEAHNVTIQLF